MNILITVDDNYIDVALDMLYSLKLYNDNLVIHVIYDNLSRESVIRLKNYIYAYNIGELKLYHFDQNDFELSVGKIEYLTKTCYLRLYAPYIIKDVDRILYLDPDIVCLDSLDELYNTDLGDNVLGAAPNMLRKDVEYLKEIMLNSLKLPLDSEYVNSGVLLIDMNKYRESLSLEGLNTFLKNNNHTIEYQDQDTINFLFNRKIKILDNKYNYQINAVDWWKIDLNQVLIHYSEAKKPWKEDYHDLLRARPYYQLLHFKGEDSRIRKLIYHHGLNNAQEIFDNLTEEKK